jgi:Family of unknown function (DUF5677)
MSVSSFQIVEPNAEFRSQLRERHADAFNFAAEVGRTIAEATVRTQRIPDDVGRALDMLMQQAWKAHSSVCVLTQRAFIKDATTITRRLLELSVQSFYIARPDDPRERLDRARRFLAKLWHSTPKVFRESLPDDDREYWEQWFDTHREHLPDKAKTWWPKFQDMFQSVGIPKAYEDEYRFFSCIAHGLPSIHAGPYAKSLVNQMPELDISVLLCCASNYLICTVHNWNGIFQLIPSEQLARLTARGKAWRGIANVTTESVSE